MLSSGVRHDKRGKVLNFYNFFLKEKLIKEDFVRFDLFNNYVI